MGNIPVIGKLQILTFVGMLESYGEIPGDVPHYTAPGGKPGYYPPIKGNRPEIPGDVPHYTAPGGPLGVEGPRRAAARLHRRLPEVLGRHHGAVRGPVPRERGARRVDRGGPRPLG